VPACPTRVAIGGLTGVAARPSQARLTSVVPWTSVWPSTSAWGSTSA
jgi:hypothetical protein